MPLNWSEALTQRFREMRAAGKSLEVCAEELRISYAEACRKAQELGLNQKMNHGQRRGEDMKANRK